MRISDLWPQETFRVMLGGAVITHAHAYVTTPCTTTHTQTENIGRKKGVLVKPKSI